MPQNIKRVYRLRYVKRIIYVILSFTLVFSLVLMAFKVTIPVLADSFTDNSQATFNGTFANTQWSGANAGINMSSTGQTARTATFTSAIKNFGGSKVWENISWTTTGPYNLELPNNGVNETIYTSGNANMTSSRLLLHLNEAGGTTFSQTSGQNITITCVVSSCPTIISGKFGNARRFNGTSSFLTSSTNLTTDMGRTVTLAAWVRTTAVGNATFYFAGGITGVEQDGAMNDIFFGWQDQTGRLGFQHGNEAAVKSEIINDGNWHHVAMTRNITTGRVEMYTDGALTASATQPTTARTTAFTTIGRIQNSNTGTAPKYFNGDLDEVSTYARVLTSTEIQNLYLRGAARILFQSRSCPNISCNNIPFKGPTSTTDYYTNDVVSLNTFPSSTLTNINDNPYFQYQAKLETDKNTLNPILKSVTVTYNSSLFVIPDYFLAFRIRNSSDTLDANFCNLGEIKTSSTSSCSYRLKVRTNLPQGYSIYVVTSGGITTGDYEINNAPVGTGGTGGANISSLTLGIENYGIAINKGTTTQNSNVSLSNDFNAGLNNAVKFNYQTDRLLLSTNSGNSPTTPDTTNTTLITHKLNIKSDTPAGKYNQTIRYTLIANF